MSGAENRIERAFNRRTAATQLLLVCCKALDSRNRSIAVYLIAQAFILLFRLSLFQLKLINPRVMRLWKYKNRLIDWAITLQHKFNCHLLSLINEIKDLITVIDSEAYAERSDNGNFAL